MIDRGVLRSSVLIIIIFILINFLTFNIFGNLFSLISITGKATAIDDALVSVFITGEVTVFSPLNTTYNFNQGEMYILPLNVSADFTADDWEYSLYDISHDVYLEQNTPFTPNSSIVAARWGNKLTVYAHEQDGYWYHKNVTFFIGVPNSAPIIGNMSDEIFVCENDNLLYEYNATDIDEEILIATISSPNPFFTRRTNYDDNVTTFFEIVSIPTTKNNAGGVGGVSSTYQKTITVYDAEPLIDTKNINITVIEVNNEPVIINQLGAQTIWISGDDSNFTHQYNVSDTEDGFTVDENLTFNLSFVGINNLFEIDSTNGSMFYEPVQNDIGETYNLIACVEDNSLSSSHENFSICQAEGHRNTSWVVCDSFSLTITDENRAPEITNWTPTDSDFSIGGQTSFSLFAKVYDADGTVPDIDWYVDGSLREHNENADNDSFSYTFGCGVSGVHEIEVVTTDGLLNDSFIWNVNVNVVACQDSSPSGGGSSGGSFSSQTCSEDWLCGDWDICQNVEKSFDSKVLSKEDYIYFQEICFQNGYDDERFCGFQIKNCVDINKCENSVLKIERPEDMQACYYTENPSCHDSITNCHDGSCESLVDCGGPCDPCPTCSDKKQNQKEEGIDCGGPCPFVCAQKSSFKLLKTILIILAVSLGFVIIYFGYRLFLILRERYYSY